MHTECSVNVSHVGHKFGKWCHSHRSEMVPGTPPCELGTVASLGAAGGPGPCRLRVLRFHRSVKQEDLESGEHRVEAEELMLPPNAMRKDTPFPGYQTTISKAFPLGARTGSRFACIKSCRAQLCFS